MSCAGQWWMSCPLHCLPRTPAVSRAWMLPAVAAGAPGFGRTLHTADASEHCASGPVHCAWPAPPPSAATRESRAGGGSFCVGSGPWGLPRVPGCCGDPRSRASLCHDGPPSTPGLPAVCCALTALLGSLCGCAARTEPRVRASVHRHPRRRVWCFCVQPEAAVSLPASAARPACSCRLSYPAPPSQACVSLSCY